MRKTEIRYTFILIWIRDNMYARDHVRERERIYIVGFHQLQIFGGTVSRPLKLCVGAWLQGFCQSAHQWGKTALANIMPNLNVLTAWEETVGETHQKKKSHANCVWKRSCSRGCVSPERPNLKSGEESSMCLLFHVSKLWTCLFSTYLERECLLPV